MTTGMSAPPIGIMIKIPIKKDSARIDQNIASFWSRTIKIIKPKIEMPSIALKKCCPLKVRGAPEIIPCSLPKAMIEPVNVIAPIASPSVISIKLAVLIFRNCPIPYASGL